MLFAKLPLELREIIYRHAILLEDLTSESKPLSFGATDARRGATLSTSSGSNDFVV
jgi:hypothetical protein